MQLMAKEFLEYRLGIDATEKNVSLLAEYIVKFEKEVSQENLKIKSV